jgi:site-specific recombinase
MQLATKYTHKDSSYSNQVYLASKLDTIADRVIKRGVLVVEKNSDGFFNLIDYFNKTIIVADVPTVALAKSICDYLNSKRDTNKRKFFVDLQHLINNYHKLNNDCIFYRHTIKVAKDIMRVEIALTRLDVTLVKLKTLHQQIQHYTI